MLINISKLSCTDFAPLPKLEATNKVTIGIKGQQVHFIVLGLYGNFSNYVRFAKESANLFIDISQHSWTECVQFTNHSDPI